MKKIPVVVDFNLDKVIGSISLDDVAIDHIKDLLLHKIKITLSAAIRIENKESTLKCISIQVDKEQQLKENT